MIPKQLRTLAVPIHRSTSVHPFTMLRNRILYALAVGAREGSSQAARDALRGTDPLSAWRLRRRLLDAEQWAAMSVEDSMYKGHVLRLAFLREAGLLGELDYEDRTGVNAAFDQAVSSLKRPGRVWIASICFALLVIGGAAAFVPTRSSLFVFDPRTTPVGRVLGADPADYNTQMSNFREACSMGEDLQAVYVAPRDRVLSKIESNAGNDAFNAIVDVFRVHAAAVLDPSDRAAQLADPSGSCVFKRAPSHFSG